MLGQSLVGEDGFVGEVVDAAEALDWRHRGRRSRGNNDAASPHLSAARGQHARLEETRLAADDPHAQRFEALDRIVRGDRADDLVYGPVYRCEIDMRLSRPNSKWRTSTHNARRPGRCEESLGRNASGIEAFTAHLTAFDQHDACTELRGDRGGGETGGACPNDAQIGLKILHDSLFLAYAVFP